MVFLLWWFDEEETAFGEVNEESRDDVIVAEWMFEEWDFEWWVKMIGDGKRAPIGTN